MNKLRNNARIQATTAASLVAALAAGGWSGAAMAQTEAELKARIDRLERELSEAKAALKKADTRAEEQNAELQVVQEKLDKANDLGPKKITFDVGDDGKLNIGGAIRANYAIGDYEPDTGAASRAWGDDGNFALDTFRVNMDYLNGPWQGKLEYRWYNGYNFLHTGWAGYNFEDDSQLQVGVNRVPFGPGPYGVSQSWFFDQHYYVGLSDDMDLGVKYSKPFGDWKLDLAYYYTGEGQYTGGSADSARYSYDVVTWNSSVDAAGNVNFAAPENGFEERNQFNLRAIYTVPNASIATDIGASLQFGSLDGKGTDDGDHWAVSAHMVNKWDNWTLATQLTRYEYDIDAANPWGRDDLIPMGAYDFAWPVAAEAWIPAISLSYFQKTPGIDWLDYVIPYVEYSSIVKDEDDFNDSEMLTLGAAWGRGGWYIYTDFVHSNGNYFVGNEGDAYGNIFNGVGDFGVNGNDEWNSRFNINFGYYF